MALTALINEIAEEITNNDHKIWVYVGNNQYVIDQTQLWEALERALERNFVE